MPELTGPTLGKGFTALAQAIIQVAQQIRIGNQMTALKMRAEYMGVSPTTNADFRRIEGELFPDAPAAKTKGGVELPAATQAFVVCPHCFMDTSPEEELCENCGRSVPLEEGTTRG
ncbi:hypothetical protein [Nocardia phage KYD2]|nr:hypothetical protein [Nocardia phage KYD2]